MNDPVMQMPEARQRRFTPGRVGMILSLVLILLVVFSVTIIESGQTAVMIRAGGDKARVISSPGVYLRVPFVERVWLIDTRLQTTEQIELQLVTTSDKQPLSLAGWVAWRVTDPVQFQTANAADKGALNDRLRKALGEALSAWSAAQPANNILKRQSGEMPQAWLADLNQRLNALGLEAVQAGLRQVSLSDTGNDAICARMSAVKNQRTRQLIDGLAADERQLLALQNRQQAQVLDDAYRMAQQTRHNAEQQLLAAYARQYGQSNKFADALGNPPRPAGKSDN